MHRVVIIGAGFGGLSAARSLAGKPVDVTIIDQRNFHTFQPLLYEVSTAGLDPGDVAYPIRAIFGRVPNVTFRYGTVNGVDWANKTVGLDEEESIAFDSLIVASGATVKYFGIPGAAQYAHALYTLADARYLRDHILRRLEEVDADPRLAKDALTFVVIGGGPTGVEVAGALAELLDVSVRHDGFRFDRSQARIILVDGLDRLLSPFAPPASRYTAATLANRGVDLRLGRMVNEVTEDCVALDDGSTIACRTVVWAGGVTVEGTIAAQIKATGGPNGRLVVEPDLSLPGHPDAYGIGDASAVLWGPGAVDPKTGHPKICPQLAQVAIQSGKHAAAQIVNRVEGRPTEPFRYHDKGIMATIGRRAAVTQFPRGLIIRGTLGWLAWLGLHLLYLIGFRNKLIVLVNWSWRYLSWASGPRIIVGGNIDVHDPEPPGPEEADPRG